MLDQSHLLAHNGNAYILVMVDFFTKWVEMAAVPDTKASTTANCIYKHIISRHGPPKAILSDRGSGFVSKVFRHLCDKLNINKPYTTSYNAAGNGFCERQNRTLKSMLTKCLIDKQHADWEQRIDDVCYAYRASVHSSTNQTPHYLTYGAEVNTPISQILNCEPDILGTPTDYVSQLTERLRVAFQCAKEVNAKAREQQKSQYDKRAKELDYHVGDNVLLDIKVVAKGDSKKFTPKYKGPYKVIKVYDNQTVDIANDVYEIQRVHVNRLKAIYVTMLWGDEECPPHKPADKPKVPFRRSRCTQTKDPGASDDDSEDSDEEEEETSAQQTVNPINRYQKPPLERVKRVLPKKAPLPTIREETTSPPTRPTNLRPRTALKTPERYRE